MAVSDGRQVYKPLIEHPVYKNYIAAGALAVLLILAAVMFWAIFLAPTENPKVDPKAVERMQKGQNERYSDEPPPKKTQAQKLQELREYLDKTDDNSRNFLFSARGRKTSKRARQNRRKLKGD